MEILDTSLTMTTLIRGEMIPVSYVSLALHERSQELMLPWTNNLSLAKLPRQQVALYSASP